MAFCVPPEHQAAVASVSGDSAWVPGSLGKSNMIFVNLPGSLHRGPVAQMTHSEALQVFSFFLRRVEDFIPLSSFIRNSSEKMSSFACVSI